MERKLVRQGRNALTVTLPAKWLKARGLSAGASVTIEEQKEGLAIAAGLVSARKEITLDLRDTDKKLVWQVVQGKYIEGYDRIIIIHNISTLSAEMGPAFLGMIIEEHSAEKLVLKSIIAVPEETFGVVFRRAGHILLEQARVLEQYSRKKANLSQLDAEEKLLNQNILYCMRYLNKYESKESSYRYFLLCSCLETAGDQLMELSKVIGKNSTLPGKISKLIEDYTSALFSSDFRKAYSVIRAFRDSLKKTGFETGLAFSLAENLYNYLGYLVEYNGGK